SSQVAVRTAPGLLAWRPLLRALARQCAARRLCVLGISQPVVDADINADCSSGTGDRTSRLATSRPRTRLDGCRRGRTFLDCRSSIGTPDSSVVSAWCTG